MIWLGIGIGLIVGGVATLIYVVWQLSKGFRW
jgi:hypothetical protein